MAQKFTASLVIITALWVGLLLRSGIAEQSSSLTFADVTQSVGLVEPIRGIMGHAAAWGDVDGDGRVDLYVGTFCDRPAEDYIGASGAVPNRLLLNRGARFERAQQPSLELVGRGSGAVFLDYDNDGDLDLYVSNNSVLTNLPEPRRAASARRNALFANDGRGNFTDVSDKSGACPPAGFIARNVGVLDFDGDGWLDLLLLEDIFRKPRNQKPRSLLFRNKRDLTFEVANSRAGLPDDIHGLGLAIADLNRDGRPDFFVAQSNRLFLSKGDGTYREATELKEVFAWNGTNAEDVSCGAAFGDVDRDGDFDLVVTSHFIPARNRFYLNVTQSDRLRYVDATREVGLGAPVPTKCPHVEIADMDNDGWMDVYVSAVFLEGRGTRDEGRGNKVVPLIYRNLGAKDGISRFAAPAFDKPMNYFPAAPTADYDNDGDLDIAGISFFPDFPSRLLRNDSPRRNYLNVEVCSQARSGTKCRQVIGATVRVYHNGALLGVQEVATGYGYSSGQPAVCHFGLGDEKTCDVEVTFPLTRRTKRLKNVAANQTLKGVEE